MKSNAMKFTFFFLLVSLTFTLTSCSEDPVTSTSTTSGEGIVGVWVLDDVEIEESEDAANAQLEMMKSMMQMMKGRMKFSFNEDGTAEMNSEVLGQSINEKGTYTTDDGNLTIIGEAKGKQNMEYKVVDDRLIISSDEEDQKVQMVFIRE